MEGNTVMSAQCYTSLYTVYEYAYPERRHQFWAQTAFSACFVRYQYDKMSPSFPDLKRDQGTVYQPSDTLPDIRQWDLQLPRPETEDERDAYPAQY